MRLERDCKIGYSKKNVFALGMSVGSEVAAPWKTFSCCWLHLKCILWDFKLSQYFVNFRRSKTWNFFGFGEIPIIWDVGNGFWLAERQQGGPHPGQDLMGRRVMGSNLGVAKIMSYCKMQATIFLDKLFKWILVRLNYLTIWAVTCSPIKLEKESIYL